ncbi:MAG: hypothetical protein HOQ28_07215 [Thermoleophilia bacterium]|nr:hypothetical protein [Thermoleophilia bacterium]
MADDFAIEWGPARDESIPQRDGSIARYKTYTFWIGKHGPFTERVPREPAFDELEINRRAESIRTHLRSLPR